jgi:hypothetical protein
MDREGRIEADLLRVMAQEPSAHSVKGPGPGDPSQTGRVVGGDLRRSDTLHASGHLRSRPSGKRQKQDPSRVGTRDNEMGYAVSEGIRFS